MGFTCLTPRFPIVTELARACKELLPRLVTVVGGAHVNGAPNSVLRSPYLDFGIIGEGEEALIEFLDRAAAGRTVTDVRNLVWRDGDLTRINPPRPFLKDLDVLPFPAWDLLPLDTYVDPALYRGSHVGIMTGRGCPHSCLFCASRVSLGRRVRLHSAAYMVNQIRELIQRFGIHDYMIYDDTFTIQRQRTLDICRAILEDCLQVRYYVQARADTLDDEIAVALKASGCLAVAIGVESGDDVMLKRINKGETKDDIRRAVGILRKADLPCVTSYILGLPDETHEAIRATLQFAEELGTEQAKFMIATPYPGTGLYDLAVERGLIKPGPDEDYSQYTYYQHVAANLSCVSDDDLKRYQQEAYDKYERVRRPLISDM